MREPRKRSDVYVCPPVGKKANWIRLSSFLSDFLRQIIAACLVYCMVFTGMPPLEAKARWETSGLAISERHAAPSVDKPLADHPANHAQPRPQPTQLAGLTTAPLGTLARKGAHFQAGGTSGQSSITSNFNGTAISAGNYVWFSSVLKTSGMALHRSAFSCATLLFNSLRMASITTSLSPTR